MSENTAVDIKISAEYTIVSSMKAYDVGNEVLVRQYGILATKQCHDGQLEHFEVEHISPSLHEVKSLVKAFKKHGLDPANMKDAVEDWLIDKFDIAIKHKTKELVASL